MGEFLLGRTSVPYQLRHSDSATRVHLKMTLDGMTVTAPTGLDDTKLEEALHSKRKWIISNHQEFQRKLAETHKIVRFRTGAKIPYWGRLAKLRVAQHDKSYVMVRYAGGFDVTCPNDADDQMIETAIHRWLVDRLKTEAKAIGNRHSKALGKGQLKLRVQELQTMWGSCGSNGVVSLDWHLIFAPKKVMQYAVAHEVSHLIERNHTKAFWDVVRGLHGDFETAKAWLDQNEHMLGYRRVPLVNTAQEQSGNT